MKICPKCEYTRKVSDTIVPETECPSCGVVYAKFTQPHRALVPVPPASPRVTLADRIITVSIFVIASTGLYAASKWLHSSVGLGFVALAALICIYFVPSIVAESRRHRNKNAIFILNLLLGWTFLGWVAALVWAATDYTRGG